MTQDEIIEMAIKAGLLVKRGLLGRCSESNFEAFAKLVAAKEREACANMCDVAAEQCGETISNFGANELMEKSVATGAMYQAKKLSKSIRARGEA